MPEEDHHNHLIHNPIEWLDQDFFVKILGLFLGDPSITIKDFFISINSHSADHYSSSMYRATVEYETKHKNGIIHMIIKLISSKVSKQADFTFESEMNIYKNIMPEVRRLLKLTGDDSGEISPKLIYCAIDPQPIIILEDVSHRMYLMNKTSLNLRNTQIVASKLAKWHAASFYMERDLKNKYVKDCNKGLFNLKSNDGLLFMLDNMRIFKEEVAKWPGFEKYADKIENLHRLFMRRGSLVFKPNDSSVGYNVLNHGDFHYNNMLFKMEENPDKLKDVLFIDYQLAFWGTPAIDLFYMLYLVPDNDTREKHREEIIYHYHEEFLNALKCMGITGKTPSLLDVNCELLKNGFMEVLISICFMPFLFADTIELTHVHSEETEELNLDKKDIRRKLYNNLQYKNIMSKLLPEFYYKGLLD